MKITNDGNTTQAFKVPGRLATVKPGKTAVIKGLDLTDEQIAHYESLGIKFGEAKKLTAAQKKKAAAEKKKQDEADAKAAQDLADQKQKLIDDSIQELKDAEQAARDAETDDDKAAAQQLVDDATAVLEGLKNAHAGA